MPALVSTAILVLAMWFLLVRPQRRRAMEHAALLARLEVGHRVITAGGIHGVIEEIGDQTMRLAIATGTTVTVERRAIARDLDAGEPDTSVDDDGAEADG
ncbi:MAG: preprotein translocase subunit YajC [Actinobacteria bacterium]|nr:preprotein translocase subunit YajC [Actinomycetota bacterium]